MEHADGVARRPARDGGARSSPAPAARRAQDGVTTASCAAAGVGLALTVVVGVATVTATLVEGGGTDRVPTVVADSPPAPSPEMLRLWGLRVGPPGALTPFATSEEVPRTAMERLYADLLARPGR